MGFHEFGQSLLGIGIVVAAMLVAFGGYQNQGLFEEYLPDGVTNPNNIDNTIVVVSTSEGTPFATPSTGAVGQENNPILNLIFNQIGQVFKTIIELPGALLDILTYIGLPKQISFPILALAGFVIIAYLTYYIAQVGVGAFAGFFK